MAEAPFDWVVFDLNGTLLDPSAIVAGLPLEGEETALALLDETVEQAMVDTLVGWYRPFSEYLRAAISRRLRLSGFDDTAERMREALAAARTLPAYPDTTRALEVAREAGLRIATITNSPSESAEAALEASGTRAYFDAVVGSDHARAYKPASVVYRTGLDRIGTRPSRACMVAAHGWDVHGAKAAGMFTAWVGHKERRLLDTVSSPDFSGVDLVEVCHSLAAAVRS
ncbi:2-haloacid dehalogenase [Saccharopolyspora lacisalsi]|uniref:2-haloacid dehalogenase n=1 Tax=Halosaccharopolyspora lacisalsi TaxID=1000566 RepID=A0A839DSH0_9PSEU|nr:haloacid dehalogenase type II [Halosaccharopolyspora lacisalsi]MBA8824454.1 2-haloacid dehalogenase [Halosaccharopolyspora lacisalsi]